MDGAVSAAAAAGDMAGVCEAALDASCSLLETPWFTCMLLGTKVFVLVFV